MRTSSMVASQRTKTLGKGTMKPTSTAATPTDMRLSVVLALRAVSRRVAPLWPLERFVAVNPYMGLTDRTFPEVAELLASVSGARATLPAAFYLAAIDEGRVTDQDLNAALAGADRVSVISVTDFLQNVRVRSEESTASAARVPTVASVAAAATGRDWVRLCTDRISVWAAAYFDDGQATWVSADASQSLFSAWKEEASLDRTPEVMGLRGFRTVVRSLPDDPLATAELVLSELGIPSDAVELYLHALALRVGGWAAHAARIVFERQLLDQEDDTVVEFLAVLLGWELAIFRTLARRGVAEAWGDARSSLGLLGDGLEARASLADLLILQDAFDRSEQRRIINQLADRDTTIQYTTANDTGRPRAQAVFCIDVRSEVFRRNLEFVADDIDTIGFAGFFGFPIEFVPIAHEEGEAQCPVLLTPSQDVAEAIPDPARNEEAVEARRLSHHVRRAWKSFKMGAISCFSFVGPVGLLYLPKMFTDAYGKTRPTKRAEDEGLAKWAVAEKAPHVTIPLDARIQLAEGALRAMSLTHGFAPTVLVVGHGASTVNNPYDTGLACGACGGHTGEANARIAAMILNDAAVRNGLTSRGVHIPEDTWFVAAQHDTTTDDVTMFDLAIVPSEHRVQLDDLRSLLAEATRRCRGERAGRLGISANGSPDAAVLRRSRDWAQVRPEWGLAGCRAFIVAPRHRTQGLDLEGRSFLHSYDWREDEDFGVLELIMTAPMVVASWISLQYYASTVENGLFGSGNKTLHNVVGRIGVLEGNAGDLRVGLPWQSVHDGETFQHEPLRLNVIIEAPTDAMNAVLSKHGAVRDLCDNGWLQLLAMDETGCVSQRYTGQLRWEPAVP